MALSRRPSVVARRHEGENLVAEWSIELRHKEAVQYAMGLMRQHREELGFLPTTKLVELQEKGGLSVGVLNGDPCGYVAYEPPKPLRDCRLYQICLPGDIRRRLYGTLLMHDVEMRCSARNATGIWHKTAWDIEANEFWHAIGYYCAGVIKGGVKRNRLLNIWRKDLIAPLISTTANPQRGEKDQRRYNAMRRSGKVLLPFGWQQEELRPFVW